jgi:hypothetical protein
MADKIIENLITQLSFEFDEKMLMAFENAVNKAAKSLTALVAGATAAGGAIFLFTQKFADMNFEVGRFSEIVGLDIKMVQELGFAAQQTGGSVQSMNSFLSGLSKTISETSRGVGGGVETFGMLGISVIDAEKKLKKTDVVMLEIADSIKNLNTQAQRIEFAERLGVGEDLLLLFQQGSKAIKKQRLEAQELNFTISRMDAAAAKNFYKALLNVKTVIKGVSSTISTGLMKQFTPLMKVFTEWFKINKQLIRQNITLFFTKLVKAIQVVYAFAFKFVTILNTMVQGIGGWQNAIIAVTGALLALNATALLLPALVVGSGVAILALIDDIMTYGEGGDSALGNLAKQFPIIENLLKGVIQLSKMFAEGLKFTLAIDIQALDSLWLGLKLIFSDINDWVANLFVKSVNFFIKKLNEIPAIDIKPLKKYTAGVDYIMQGVGGDSRPISERLINKAQTTQNNKNVTKRDQNVTNHITINVQEGTQENVKVALERALQSAFRAADKNLKTQVVY